MSLRRHRIAVAAATVALGGITFYPVPANGVEEGTGQFYKQLERRAKKVASRTYIYFHVRGHRRKEHFVIFDPISYTVKAADGSLFSAFMATGENTADGGGDVALLFDGLEFCRLGRQARGCKPLVGSTGRRDPSAVLGL